MNASPEPGDEMLFGWDPTPGIVSVWADADGEVLVWRRLGERVVRERARFTPWLLAAGLDDLLYLEDDLAPLGAPGPARVRFEELSGEGYRYRVSAPSGRALGRAVLRGVSARTGSEVRRFDDLPGYYRVGPVEQYLMASGRVYFRGLAYDD